MSDGELTLTITERGIPDFEIPDWWLNVEGSATRMTPYATDIVHNKKYGSIAPFSREFLVMARHYAWPERMKYRENRHSNLAPDLLRLNEWEGREEVYRVVVDDRYNGGDATE